MALLFCCKYENWCGADTSAPIIILYIQSSNADWVQFFIAIYKDKNGKWITYYKTSSVWPGIKWIIQDFNENTGWIVGIGDKISMWHDSWVLETSISKVFSYHPYIDHHPHLQVKDLIVNGHWEILMSFCSSSVLTIFPRFMIVKILLFGATIKMVIFL